MVAAPSSVSSLACILSTRAHPILAPLLRSHLTDQGPSLAEGQSKEDGWSEAGGSLPSLLEWNGLTVAVGQGKAVGQREQ